jgi:hypothetical protein
MNVLKKYEKHYKCVTEGMKFNESIFVKQMNFIFREIMAEVLIQCGNFIMVPNQLKRLGYDSGK